MVLGQGQQLKNKQRIRLPDAAVLIGMADLQKVVTVSKDDHNIRQKTLTLGSADSDMFSHMLGKDEVFVQVEPDSFAN